MIAVVPTLCTVAKSVLGGRSCVKRVSSDTIFAHIFPSIFDPTSLHIPYPTPFLPYVYPKYVHFFYAFMPSRSRTDNKNTIQLVLPDTE